MDLLKKIAKEVAADYHVELARETNDVSSTVRAVGGLGFLNLVFVLGPAIAIGGVIFAFTVSGVAFAVSPVLLLVFSAMGLQAFTWFDFFMALTASGIGIFMSYYITKWMIGLTTRYLAFNLRVMKGDKR